MKISHDHDDRPRYFHERAKVESQRGNPVHRGVSTGARMRLMREVEEMSSPFFDTNQQWQDIRDTIAAATQRVLGWPRDFQFIADKCADMSVGHF